MNNKNININNKSLKDKQGGFKMPENYLKDFELKILKEIEDEPSLKKGRLIGFKSVLVALGPIAAILVLGYFLFINNSSEIEYDILSNELSWDEYAGFDESLIINELAVLDEESVSDLDNEIDFLINEGVTNNEIIEIYKELP